MKRIEIEIDDETDALLDAMIAGGEASKSAILRGLVEVSVRDMAQSGQVNGVRNSSMQGRNGSAGRSHADVEPPPDVDGARDDLDQSWQPPTMLSLDEVRAIIKTEKERERERTARDSTDGLAPPDSLDALVGSIHDDPVDDIDEVIYGR